MADEIGDDAVVLGAGLAGLLAARVLADRFARVTVVEQDVLPAQPALRRGVPQGSHLHGLVIAGLRAIERLLPGFADELVAHGAPALDFAADVAIRTPFGWGARFPSDLRAISASRPLVEWVVCAHVAAHPGVAIRDGTRACGLLGDATTVRAVVVRDAAGAEQELAADLVVDATGRGARTDAWLAALGCPPPAVQTFDARVGYVSRTYRIPDGHEASWRGCYVQLSAPRQPRGGVVLPIEGGRWIVSLLGSGRDRPSLREDEQLAYARSLASPVVADTIAAAEPLTPPTRSASTVNRRRSPAHASRRPGNVVLVGDAACCFNPLYAQGMTAAALGAELLGDCLDALPGLATAAPRYERRLARLTRDWWELACSGDARVRAMLPGGEAPTTRQRLAGRYLDRVLAAAAHDRHVQLAFLHVLHMLQPPSALLAPATAARVLRPRRTALTSERSRSPGAVPGGGAPVPSPSRSARP